MLIFIAVHACSALSASKLYIITLCWQPLVLDNLQTRALLQVTQLPVLHGMDIGTGLLTRLLT